MSEFLEDAAGPVTPEWEEEGAILGELENEATDEAATETGIAEDDRVVDTTYRWFIEEMQSWTEWIGELSLTGPAPPPGPTSSDPPVPAPDPSPSIPRSSPTPAIRASQRRPTSC